MSSYCASEGDRGDLHTRVTRGVALIMLVLGVAMPLAGISMLFILALDWLVIRRVAPLRRFFG
ncbi:hypothetical protein [Streptomyces lydicus]|uniref:hypothetical protein n=1 Tax=Streptomyces lydicus TaxID=47763 RepID=UPI00379E3901